MEINTEHPLVSVAVIAYNSEKYILETLDSVKEQTYDNIELVISDDCSTDNTVKICRQWASQNAQRFSNIQIIQSPVNTGQSGNYNRAFDACTGVWIKEIDGDDKLLPNCITDYINYTIIHPDAMCIFGKMIFIGAELSENSSPLCEYSFFTLSPKEQLHKLIYESNFIPSPTAFHNKENLTRIGFRHDERIPLMEDYPKWIKLLQLGVKYHFIDTNVVAYRVGNGISTQKIYSPTFYRSIILCNLYYRYPAMLNDNTEKGINIIADDICELYKYQIETEKIRNSHAYRLGKTLLRPINLIRRKLHK